MPAQKAVRHPSNPLIRFEGWPTVLRSVRRRLWVALWWGMPWLAHLVWGGQTKFLDYLAAHPGLALYPLLPAAAALWYLWRRWRTHPRLTRRPPRGPRSVWVPPNPPTRQHTRDVADILANLDYWPARTAYLLALITSAWLVGAKYPLADSLSAFPDEQAIRGVLIAVTAPILVFTALRTRAGYVIQHRRDEILLCYGVAKSALKYPDKPTRKEHVAAATPWLAVQVERWAALYEVDRAFIVAAPGADATTLDRWDEFVANINIKMPRPEEWRLVRDPRGRGGTIVAANYPRQVLWEGEYDPDPLTFRVGVNLDTGATQLLTLGEASPHICLSGATSSGKTSLGEIIAAQVVTKPMPWDPQAHGIVVIIDPKGPLANRWRDRPNVVCANGNVPGQVPDEDGNYPPGYQVMADCIKWVVDEMARREAVLARHPNAGTWVHLDGEVLAEEHFVPVLVIVDEFNQLTTTAKANGDPDIEAENNAYDFITKKVTLLAQRARNVGIHLCVISQRANMGLIGDRLMTNLPVRGVTGQIDATQLRTMFGDVPIPRLPSTYTVQDEGGTVREKTIPGRARLQNAGGQDVQLVQVYWFGGQTNSGTLDQYVPRVAQSLNGDFTPPRWPDGDAATQETHPTTPDPESHPHPTPGVIPSASPTPSPTPPAPEGGEGGAVVFPSSGAPTSVVCSVCVEDATQECPSCGTPVCEEHLTPHPDPAHTDRVCVPCVQRHPLTVAGIADLYTTAWRLATASGMSCEWAEGPEGWVTATVKVASGAKVVEFSGDGTTVQGRSKSGGFAGTAVGPRIEEVITNVAGVPA